MCSKSEAEGNRARLTFRIDEIARKIEKRSRRDTRLVEGSIVGARVIGLEDERRKPILAHGTPIKRITGHEHIISPDRLAHL